MAFIGSRSKRAEVHGITAIAVDRDRNSHLAIKWAVENILTGKNPKCILVHVHCKTLHPQNSDVATREDHQPTQRELQQIFVPYRGFCARKGVEVREVILHGTDIPRVLVDYISNNSIDNIVLGASGKNALTRRFRSADVPSSVIKSAPESCAVYVISKGKIQHFRISSQPQTPTSTASTPRKPQTPDSTAASPEKPQTSTSNAVTPTQYKTQASTVASPRQPQTPASNYAFPSKPQTTNSNDASPSKPYIPARITASPKQPQTPISNAATPRKIQTPTSTSNVTSLALSRMPTSNATNPRQQNLHKLALYLPFDSLKFDDLSRINFSPRSSKSDSSDRGYFDTASDSPQIISRDYSEFNDKSLSHMSSMDGLSLEMLHRDSISGSSEFSGPPSSQSTDISFENMEVSIASGSSKSSISSQNPQEVDSEIRRLKQELKQSMELYNSVCREAVVAKQTVREFQHLQTFEALKLEEAKLSEEAALSLAEIEKQRAKAAIEAAQMAQKIAEMESQMRKNAEKRAKHEAEERQKAIDELAKYNFCSRKYTIDEIEVATNHFAISNKIGEGGYGPVYKAMLDHTAVAIKILRPDLSQGQKQFRQEVEVLSNMRHPNMVILLGSCPEYGCLVYEYMERGSLEDRLLMKGNTPPIPWRIRFKIAAEIATCLLFLHETKPEPLVHRDLKPANILLDGNYVSKISDVGLARLIPPSLADNVTRYRMTEAAGTFWYIDPEYQQTGMLSVKSDLYSLGILLLQLITAKHPMGLTHNVEEAIVKGTFSTILDQALTDWPVEEALSLAKLALKCCELRKKDRPDLASVIVPELNWLRNFALADKTGEHVIISPPPSVLELQTNKNQEGMRNPNVEMENST